TRISVIIVKTIPSFTMGALLCLRFPITPRTIPHIFGPPMATAGFHIISTVLGYSYASPFLWKVIAEYVFCLTGLANFIIAVGLIWEGKTLFNSFPLLVAIYEAIYLPFHVPKLVILSK
ncbi:hypothetical protein PFISCL1PPCAC_3168, partial [Pristionchus fissidentatus]